MKITKKTRLATAIGGGLTILTVLLLAGHAVPVSAATPTVFVANTNGPVNGVAAIPGKVLFTTQQSLNVFQADVNGVVTPFATVPANAACPVNFNPLPSEQLPEQYLAVSTGAGGVFAAGDIYMTRLGCVFKISSNGAAVSLFATIPGITQAHTGIVFDRVGTFGFNLITTYQNGKIYSINAAGTPTLLTTLANDVTEGPDVAPATFLPAPGRLLVSQENQNVIVAIDPPSGGNVPPNLTFHTLDTLADIESIHVIPALLCNLSGGVGSGADGVFFTTNEALGQILKFSAADFIGVNGILLPGEFPPSGGAANSIAGISNSPATPNRFVFETTTTAVHEGSTFVACNPTLGCTLTQGYYKTHPGNWPAAFTGSLTLGTVSYTQAQLLLIYGTPVKGNGLVSLAHQLITAKLNALKGASVPAAVQAAITAADALIGSLVVPPIGGGYLSPSSTSGLITILDNYNNGLAPGGPGHCAD